MPWPWTAARTPSMIAASRSSARVAALRVRAVHRELGQERGDDRLGVVRAHVDAVEHRPVVLGQVVLEAVDLGEEDVVEHVHLRPVLDRLERFVDPGVLGEDLRHRGFARRIDEQPVEQHERLVTGGAVHRPGRRQDLAPGEDLLDHEPRAGRACGASCCA